MFCKQEQKQNIQTVHNITSSGNHCHPRKFFRTSSSINICLYFFMSFQFLIVFFRHTVTSIFFVLSFLFFFLPIMQFSASIWSYSLQSFFVILIILFSFLFSTFMMITILHSFSMFYTKLFMAIIFLQCIVIHHSPQTSDYIFIVIFHFFA